MGRSSCVMPRRGDRREASHSVCHDLLGRCERSSVGQGTTSSVLDALSWPHIAPRSSLHPPHPLEGSGTPDTGGPRPPFPTPRVLPSPPPPHPPRTYGGWGPSLNEVEGLAPLWVGIGGGEGRTTIGGPPSGDMTSLSPMRGTGSGRWDVVPPYPPPSLRARARVRGRRVGSVAPHRGPPPLLRWEGPLRLGRRRWSGTPTFGGDGLPRSALSPPGTASSLGSSPIVLAHVKDRVCPQLGSL